jgi:hypothetical protein
MEYFNSKSLYYRYRPELHIIIIMTFGLINLTIGCIENSRKYDW